MNRTKTPRLSEVRPPLPDTLPHVPSLENLDEITVWLGTIVRATGIALRRRMSSGARLRGAAAPVRA